jgi:hypothetical protein
MTTGILNFLLARTALISSSSGSFSTFLYKKPVHSLPGFGWRLTRFRGPQGGSKTLRSFFRHLKDPPGTSCGEIEHIFDPITIGPFGMNRIMMKPHEIPNFIQQLTIILGKHC